MSHDRCSVGWFAQHTQHIHARHIARATHVNTSSSRTSALSEFVQGKHIVSITFPIKRYWQASCYIMATVTLATHIAGRPTYKHISMPREAKCGDESCTHVLTICTCKTNVFTYICVSARTSKSFAFARVFK